MPQPHTYPPPKPGDILLTFEGDRRDIDAYEQAGGYEQLRRAIGMTDKEIIAQVSDSGLRGRGGAGFPTGKKASFLAPPQPRYLVINADESEPGTFKDRELMLRNPHALIEGILIMSWAIRAAQAFIYIRGEYLTEYEVLVDAVAQARERGYVNQPLLGTDYTPDIVVHRGAGAYICGEETALLSSLNGFRGQPTAKPPFPAVAGAYMSPTLLNNVETIATVPYILALGGTEYASVGTEQSKGTRLFSLSGPVQRPGNYELPVTASFRDLIEGCGGGMRDGLAMKCFVPGGSSTPILLPDQIDTGLAFEAVTAAGSMSGSGAIIVVDDRTCMVQFGLRVAEFYQHESCGKCTPCREGTRWVVDLLRRIESGAGQSYEIDLLLNICDRIEGKCLCPLGDACAMPVRSYLKHFRDEFEEHVTLGHCPYHEQSPLSSLYPQPKSLLPLVPA
jgi:NADH-quinone oxidoreductase subunit F